MSRIILPLIFGPLWIVVGWVIYLAAKWCAGWLVSSPIDQTAMAFIAVLIAAGVVIAAMFDQEA